MQELKAQLGLGYGVVILTIQLICGKKWAKISIFGPNFSNLSYLKKYCFEILNFCFGSKLTKIEQKCQNCQNSLKSAFVAPFLQFFAIISKTVHYFFLTFCRNLRHNKGLGMEWSFWPYNYFLVQNRPKSAFLGPIFEICQIFPFFFKFWKKKLFTN